MVKTAEYKLMEYEEGWEVTISMEGGIEKYALSFLHIFNNVKEHSELVRVTNDYANGVSVVCYADALEPTKAYLSQFGPVTNVVPVLIVRCGSDIEYSDDLYDSVVCDFEEF